MAVYLRDARMGFLQMPLADRVVLFEHRADRHEIEDGIKQMLGRDPMRTSASTTGMAELDRCL
jgi:hypothetical protein